MNRRRLVVDCRMLFESGIGSYLRGLLPRLIERMPEVEFVALARSSDFAGVEALVGGRAIRCDAGVYSALEQLSLWRAIPRGVAAFWAPHFNLPLAFRGKLVVTVHDLFPFALGRELGTRLDKLYYTRAMLRGVRWRASHIVCVSEFTRRELVRFLGVPAQPVSVVPNGIDPVWFSDVSAPSPRPKPYLLYVGNVKPHKNVARLLGAFGEIAERIPHELVIAGERHGFSDRRSRDQEQLAGVGAPRVVFTGKLAAEDLRRHVRHADALVLPSLYEGFGLPPLEAMACGVPVLVSRAAALPEVCGDAALYCDPLSVPDIAEKLARLLLDQALRARLRALGTARARSFDWNRSADSMADVFLKAGI